MDDCLRTPIKYYALRAGKVRSPAFCNVDSTKETLPNTEDRACLYILAGQSNMAGRGVPAELPESLVVEVEGRVHLCYDHDQNFAEKTGQTRAVAAWKPLTREAQYSYGGECHHFGPEFSLSKVLLASGKNIFLAKFAMGSTNLHTDWRPDGRYFKNLVEFIRGAVSSAPVPVKVSGVFWLQGESDSSGNAGQINAYEQNLVNFFAELRRELGDPSLPVVASQVDFHYGPSSLGKRPKKLGRINEAIRAACAREDMQPAECSMLERELSMHDDGHMDSSALLEIGALMGDAYARLTQGIELDS